MNLAHDYIVPTPHGGRCGIRIYLPEDDQDAPVVVCTEPEDNPGMSITNAADGIAGEVIAAHGLPVPVVWIEHYEDGMRGTEADPQTFDLVLFSHYEVRDRGIVGEEQKQIGKPSWKPLDRATVEALIGGPVS